MMATPTTYYLEGQDQVKIALSRERIHTLFNQLETELYNSETYQQVLTNLCEQVEESGLQLYQALIQAVGREAIRLTLRQLIRQYRSTPASPPSETVSFEETSVTSSTTVTTAEPEGDRPLETISVAAESRPVQDLRTDHEKPSGWTIFGGAPRPQKSSNCVSPAVVTIATPASYRSSSDRPPSSGSQQGFAHHHPATMKRSPNKPKSPETEQREAALKKIGQTLQQARLAQGTSLEYLHTKTWVPVHQIKALELGEADRLPEDIYIQGFIRRIAAVLQLDANHLLAPLTGIEPVRTVIPSWQQPSYTPRQLQPVHLYLGYTALMAGAIGGLAWMSQQTTTEQLLNQPLLDFQPDTPIVETNPNQPTMVQSPTTEGAIAAPEFIPPEAAMP